MQCTILGAPYIGWRVNAQASLTFFLLVAIAPRTRKGVHANDALLLHVRSYVDACGQQGRVAQGVAEWQSAVMSEHLCAQSPRTVQRERQQRGVCGAAEAELAHPPPARAAWAQIIARAA